MMLSSLKRAKSPVVSIIDDDKSIRAATNRLVKSLGLEPHTFVSAEEFLQSSDLYNAACIIADVRMPGMSGVALQKQLADEGRHVPIIFITAYPEETVRAQALQAGAIAFLTKPFEGKSLIKCLAAALKKPDDDSVH